MNETQLDGTLARCVYDCFITDIEAFKPGNVSRYADGHGMRCDDFVKSAELSTPLLCDRGLPVGHRILASVKTVMEEVGCNTNLGLVLLFAPLIFAMQHKQSARSLHLSLGDILEGIGVEESAEIFAAIRLANPGGLGQSSQYDVHLHPEVTIKKAMMVSRDRDRIAYQYVSQYKDIFELGLETITTAIGRWNSLEWATVACYLAFLSEFHDSHVQRKSGERIAQEVRTKAQPIKKKFASCSEPESMIDDLMDFDRELKQKGINPGTSADLSVTSLLVYRLTRELE